jgi:hypothetical protein
MHISIDLRATWWDEAPKTKISLDGINLWQGSVDRDISRNFNVQIDDANASMLSIELHDKKIDQTVCDGTKILQDQLLTIDRIAIDGIDLGHLLYSHSEYWPRYPQHLIDEFVQKKETLPCPLHKVTTLGFNGVWKLTFTHPFEIWYLENLP